MNSTYILRISVDSSLFDQVSSILATTPDATENGWDLVIEQKTEDGYVDYIEHFVGILESKYELLREIGIEKSDITIWVYHEYVGQCNMEFSPNDLSKLGRSGIQLCISCWQEGGHISLNDSEYQ